MPVKVEGLQSVVQKMATLAQKHVDAMNANLHVAGTLMHVAVLEHVELTGYTLEDFEMMGFPYSRKRSKDSGPSPDDFTYVQSGLLSENIEKNESLGTLRSSVEVGVSAEKVPYVDDLIHGNSKMRPRNFLGGAWEDVRDDVKAEIKGGGKP